MSSEVPVEFRPRLCHVVKWDDFPGYGFNLHAEKGKAGQFIGKVDQNSPAESAGLKEGDRIVEVNGVNIGNENHQQVVTRVRSGGDETRLLVVDNSADDWFKRQKLVVKGDLSCVVFGTAKRDTLAQEDGPEPVVEYTPTPDPKPEPVIVPEVEPEVAAPVANGNGDVNEDHLHKPRLCHLRLWPHFQGYGFNLHAEKDKPGQFIGLVDDNSPSSTAGLRVQDRIVEVNGSNIEKEGHAEVISRIKAIPDETRLLVVDPEVDAYYRERGITVSSSMPQTEYIVTPDPGAQNDDVDKEDGTIGTYETVGALQVENEETKVKEEEVIEEVVALALVETMEEEKEKEEEAVASALVEKMEEEKVMEEAVASALVEKMEEEKVMEEVVALALVETMEEEKEKEEKEKKELEELVQQQPPEEEPEVVVVVSEPEEIHADADVSNGLAPEEPTVVAVAPPEPEPEPEPEYTVAEKKAPAPAPEPVAAPAPAPVPTPAASSDASADGLELNISVSEMKERLKAKKRQDPRLNKVPFEQKYRQFQRM